MLVFWLAQSVNISTVAFRSVTLTTSGSMAGLSDDVILTLVKNRLNCERIKLWAPPYSEEDGTKAKFTEELELRYCAELGFPIEKVRNAVEQLRMSSLERLAARNNFLLNGVAALKIKVTSPQNKDKKTVFVETKLDTKGSKLRELVAALCTVEGATGRIKLICGGRIIVDDSSLEQQNINVNSVIMAVVVAEMEAESAATSSNRAMMQEVRQDAELLSDDLDDAGSLMNIADQSGRAVNIPKEEKKALALAMVLNEKGKGALRRKDYSEALLFLLEADKEFKKCAANILSMVDNYALLCLDITWCYLCLRSIDELPDAETRLKTCEDCLRKSYGANLERLKAVKGATGSESALFVRLHLLQGIAAFHRHQLKIAGKLLHDVETEIKSLKVDDEKLAQVMALGYSAAKARLGLRNSGGDAELAVSFLILKKREKQEQELKDKEDAKKKALSRVLGKTANGEWVNADFYNSLMSMGYSSGMAREALKQTNNNISLAVQIIQDNPDLLRTTDNTLAITDDLIAQVVSLGFDQLAARGCLAKHEGNLQAAIEELLSTGGVFLDTLAEAVAADNVNGGGQSAEAHRRMQLNQQEALDRLRSDITDDEDAHLDLTLEEETAFLDEYKQLLKFVQI